MEALLWEIRLMALKKSVIWRVSNIIKFSGQSTPRSEMGIVHPWQKTAFFLNRIEKPNADES